MLYCNYKQTKNKQLKGVIMAGVKYSEELEPQFDRRKSFYGKAHVLRMDDGSIILQSYATQVAVIKDGKLGIRGDYSATTTRHIKEFARQNGFHVDSMRRMLTMYGDDSYWDR